MRKKTMENFSQRIFQFGKLGRKLGGIKEPLYLRFDKSDFCKEFA